MKYFVVQIWILWVIFLISTGASAQENTSAKSYEEFIRDHRALKDSMFLGENSPLNPDIIAHYQGLRYYPADQKYQLKAQFKVFEKQKKIKIKNTQGGDEIYLKYGQLSFSLEGKLYSLIAYKPEADRLMRNPLARKRLLVPFRDASNGQETYAGGRYLDFQMSLPREEVILDFNLAYNPYCAYNPEYACLIPPAENTLPIPIEAGEKLWTKK